MIELIIQYVINEPTIETATLFTKLNNQISRASQGIASSQRVTVCDSRKDEDGNDVDMPYVRLYDDGQTRAQDRAIKTGGIEIQNEARLLVIECAAQGGNKFEAAQRAEKLRIVTMAVMKNIIQEVYDEGVLRLDDDGGSESYYRVDKWYVSPADDPHVKADGTTQLEAGDRTVTAQKYISIEVWLTLQLV